MAEEFDLVGKKKIIIDRAGYMSAPRSSESREYISDGLRNDVLGGNYFSAPDKVDKLRVCLGKNWDYRTKSNDSEYRSFDNNWTPLRVFYDAPLNLEHCEIISESYSPGAMTLSGGQIKERITLSANISPSAMFPSGMMTDESTINQLYWRWLYFIKTGIVELNGTSLDPTILSNEWNYDHRHDGFLPFTPEEMLSKQPVGQAFFANYETYYNERIRSNTPATAATLSYEKAIGSIPQMQNSLPNIYGFLRIMHSEYFTSPGNTSLTQLYDSLLPFYMNFSPAKQSELYSQVLQFIPFEVSLMLYGLIGNQSATGIGVDGTKIVEKILGFKPENTDMSALIEEYLNEWSGIITSPEYSKLGFISPNHLPMRALERIATNLIFSPNTYSMMNLVDKYKKHFPFYCELSFSAKLLTSIGDSMKQFYMTRPLSDAVSAGALNKISDPEYGPIQAKPFYMWADGQMDFIEFSSEDTYKDLSSLEVELPQGSVSSPITKTTLNLPWLLEDWIRDEPVFELGYVAGFEKTENFTSYFRNDFVEPFNLDNNDSTLWKKIFGPAFYAKIVDIYQQKRRTFEQIMAGVPAYTEDLFYRIQKSRKLVPKVANSEGVTFDEYEVVQNIIIPNTSDLDIVKYVDTQLKYSTDASYKYDVFATRIVFGSRYKYFWVNPAGFLSTQADGFTKPVEPAPNTTGLQNSDFYTQPNLETGVGYNLNLDNDQPSSVDVHATLEVHTKPSIRLIDDKIFSTPEIFIMDKPPVTPDINIIPYRAVNNRVKILLTGNSDRYRQKPVIMLDGDVNEFEKIKAAQLSYDNKVEFGSDDPVKRFQIFRTLVRPEKYSDFDLYQDIENFVFEEQVLPNTKYYYTFRAVDPHQHVSNPTPVYEVELIDEKGAVKPIIRMISMEPKENKTSLKEAQKYIYIKPSELQLLSSESNDTDSVFSDDTTKKKYKVRLTSKASGKKIDINFSFRKEAQKET